MSHKPLLIGLVLAVSGPFTAIRTWTTHTAETAIARDGVRAEGHVTRKWLHDADPGEDYMIGYSFDLPSGQRIEGQDTVSVTFYRALRKGDPIGVLYARENPRTNFPEAAGPTSRGAAVFSMTIGLLFTLLGLGLIGRHWRDNRPSRSQRRGV